MFAEEDNKEVIERTLDCIREMCEVLGAGAIVNKLEDLVKVLLQLLDKKAFCQLKGGAGNANMDEDDEDGEKDDEEEEEDEEDLDHDEIILGNTTDLIIDLSKCLGD